MNDPAHETRSTYRSVEIGDEAMLSRHPADVFRPLLAEAPVHAGEGRRFGAVEFPALWPGLEGPSFLVLSYDGVLEVLRHERVSSDIHQQGAEMSVGRSIFGMDPPEQTDVRRLLMAGFTPGQMKKWEELVIRPVTREAVAALATRERFDFVHDFAEQLPYRVFTRILRLPDDAGEWATDRAVDMVRAVTDPVAALRAAAELGDYLRGFIVERRAKPAADFISAIAQAEIEGGRRLAVEEMVNFLRHLFLAGVETTFRVFSVLMAHLLRERSLWLEVVRDRSLVANAIEESLRLDPPANYFVRKALADLEIEGHRIPAGAIVYVVVSAANRDPDRWPEPDRFDLHRPLRAHLSFSAGPHTCIGMHLARRELTAFLEELAEAMPAIALDPAAPEPRAEGWMLRYVPRLPVVVS